MAVGYQCQTCKKTVTLPKKGKVPTCCGKPMKQVPLEMCLQPSHPEHARPMDPEEPCDEFRAGTSNNTEVEGIAKCAMCDCDVEEEKIQHVKVKGKVKKICEQCVTAIKGLA